MSASYPSLLARTQRFRLGRPQRLTLTPDGRRVFFVRSRGSEDPVRCLWQLDLETGAERLLADPRALATTGTAPSAQEQTRRERARDQGSGVVAYNFDQEVRVIACTVEQELHLVGMRTGTVTPLAARAPLTDATISPDGVRVAYVHDGELRLIGTDGGD